MGLILLFKPIMDELKNWRREKILGKTVKFYGTLAVLIAGNLVSHAVGGFKCGLLVGFVSATIV